VSTLDTGPAPGGLAPDPDLNLPSAELQAPSPAPGSGTGPTKSPTRLTVELLVALAAITVLAVATGYTDLLIAVACLVAIVMIHELGHFLTAKHAGMKVTEYFVGFGPRLWSFRRGETEYGIKALPLGGYVKIPGMTNLEDVDPADVGRVYRDKPFHSRLAVALAGSTMHLVMAFLLLLALFTLVGVPNGNQLQVGQTSALGGKPGPAAAGGVRAGDVLLSVDGKQINGDVDVFTKAVQANPGVPIRLVVERDGQQQTLTVTPANGRVDHEAGLVPPKGGAPFGEIGVTLTSPLETSSLVSALGSTSSNIAHLSWASVTGIGHLFSPGGIGSRFHDLSSASASAQATANGTRPESIVAVGEVATDAVHSGVGDFLYFLVAINIFFAIFNLFPMLPLDGGHVAIAVYEKIRTGRKKMMYHADVAKLMPFTWLFIMLLGIVIVPALLNDIIHPVTNPFN
jgi:membrane-associated protease RseP (regulator of RpoE activity)